MTIGEKMIWAAVSAASGNEHGPYWCAARAWAAVVTYRRIQSSEPTADVCHPEAMAMLREMVGEEADPLAAVREYVERAPAEVVENYPGWWEKLRELVGAKP